MALDRQTLDPAALDALVGKAVSELAAGYGGLMIDIGHKLGLYKAMAGRGPVTSQEVARTAGCAERYVREWLNGQAAGGYVAYHRESQTYELTPEQAFLLADEKSPVFMPPIWEVVAAAWADEAKTIEAFRTGKGVSWGEHDGRLHCGVAAFYRNGYRASLVAEWLPALDGVVAKLEAGRAGRRHRLRPRPFDAADGRGLPELALRRLRHAPRLDRGGAGARPRGGPRGPRDLRAGGRQGAAAGAVRPRLLLRLPARPRPSGRGGARGRARRWPRTARCCSSSPMPPTRSRTT